MSNSPSSPSPLGIRQTTEAAWVAWLKSKIQPGTPLAAATVFPGQSNQELVIPALICACNNATEHIAFSGYYEVDLDIMLMASPDGGKDADTLQAQMIGQLESFIMGPSPGDSESVIAVADEVNNAPGCPPYTVYGFWVQDQTGQAVEQHWVDTIKLKVHCCAQSGMSPE